MTEARGGVAFDLATCHSNENLRMCSEITYKVAGNALKSMVSLCGCNSPGHVFHFDDATDGPRCNLTESGSGTTCTPDVSNDADNAKLMAKHAK